MTLFARWGFFNEKKNNIEWGGASGRMTLSAKWAFFIKKNNNIG